MSQKWIALIVFVVSLLVNKNLMSQTEFIKLKSEFSNWRHDSSECKVTREDYLIYFLYSKERENKYFSGLSKAYVLELFGEPDSKSFNAFTYNWNNHFPCNSEKYGEVRIYFRWGKVSNIMVAIP